MPPVAAVGAADLPAGLRPLAPGRFTRPSLELAPALLGCWLLRRESDGSWSGGPIVEVEAYDGPADRASHAHAGRTPRTAVMFGPGGCAYVYFSYGMHHLLNVVSGTDGAPGAVLLRALAPRLGVERMRARRGQDGGAERLAAGPARLCQALGIDLTFNGVDLRLPGPLWIAQPGRAALAAVRAGGIAVGPRIGVAYAGPEWASRPWRFGLRGDHALSRRFPAPAG